MWAQMAKFAYNMHMCVNINMHVNMQVNINVCEYACEHYYAHIIQTQYSHICII